MRHGLSRHVLTADLPDRTSSGIGIGSNSALSVYGAVSKVKQYFKEGRALRTETTVNDTHDFGIGRRLTQDNWEALVQVGHQVNQRFLDHQLQACQCAPDATTLQRVVLPSIEDGLVSRTVNSLKKSCE